MAISIKLLKLYSTNEINILKEKFGEKNVIGVSSQIIGLRYGTKFGLPKYTKISEFLEENEIEEFFLISDNYFNILKKSFEFSITVREIKVNRDYEEIQFSIDEFLKDRGSSDKRESLYRVIVDYEYIGIEMIESLNLVFNDDGTENEVYIYSNGIIKMTFFSEKILRIVGGLLWMFILKKCNCSGIKKIEDNF